MKKIFTYRMTLYNGYRPISEDGPLFTTRELAEQTLQRAKEANRDFSEKGMRLGFTDVKEVCLYESKDEVPIFNQKEG